MITSPRPGWRTTNVALFVPSASEVGLDRGRVQDERIRVVARELLLGRLDEERLGEERMPGAVGDYAQRQPVLGIGACERVHDVEVVCLQMRDDLLAKAVELLLFHRLVDLSPVDALLGARLADDEPVLGRAPCVLAGVDDQRAPLGERPIAAQDCVRVELRRRRIPVDGPARLEAVLGQIGAGGFEGRGHGVVLPSGPKYPTYPVSNMVPADVYELAWAGDPRISPDGRTVAYVVTRIDKEQNDYRSAIYLAPADRSTQPRRLTSGEKRDGSPRWSPDGTELAFVSNRAGDSSQLYVLPLGGGEPRRLTNLKESVREPAWSPDGTRLAFMARTPDPLYEEDDEGERRPAPFHAALLQARRRGLDRRPPAADLRGRLRRLDRARSADRRRLREHVPDLVAGRRVDRLRLGARGRLGHEARLRSLRGRGRRRRSGQGHRLGRVSAPSPPGRPTAR